ncbi:hypothetical protein L1987_64012 [Smallanthus sonchifolius]|uniref:Uncharacterized protein n=1 Tax=Smallanthus sonchifolius TaxID=185202 RepID=A0ACB9CES6_9ASTR|nr:hypothetical protein L1987_64012 [Smallanthus sonchifolius]
MEKKWKVSKADHSSSSSSSSLFRSSSLKTSVKSPLERSSSNKTTSKSSRSSQSLPRSKSANFTTKCSSFTKEHKSRFYILKRCITMLVSWNKHHNDS